jgi:primosomal protein N' (replication factor Y) (superfamily II helicase)
MPRRNIAKPDERFVQVAVMAALRQPLVYRVPEGLEVRAGQRVQVPLGSRKAIGIVLDRAAKLAPGIAMRDILRALDSEPVLSPELLTLGLWIAEYYLAPAGEVFSAMLPLRREKRRGKYLHLTDAGRQQLSSLRQRLLTEEQASPEARLLSYIDSHPGAALPGVSRKFVAEDPALLTPLIKAGWVVISEEERPRERRAVFQVKLASGPVPERPVKLSPVAARIVAALQSAGPAADHRELLKAARGGLEHLRKLEEKGVVNLQEGAAPESEPEVVSIRPPLTAAQQAVLADLSARLAGRKFEVSLLHGITGSGKTEVYLHLIDRCLAGGRTALVLVPEIALTPAARAQFRARLGGRVAMLHSGMGEAERHDEWWRVRRGEATVAIGTRSAVFAPLENLGLIIVDEEHDTSYKQMETPRYHGRDAAVVRGRLAQALVVLGSATPSLESYWNARENKYHLCVLPERVGGRPLAKVEVIDMREEFRRTHSQVPISRRLQEEIERQIASRRQTIILLNRRGYSWFLLCRSCGESQRCVNCSISLTYHKREHKLMCHYCGYSTAVPSLCPACGSEYLQYVGEGTEKIEQKFAEVFPTARVERLDRDAARRAGHFQRVLGEFREGKIDILVGTQIIAKGHDFPGVTLVGIVSADQALCLPDFRAAERTFQLLTQAAGRAGRGAEPGRVLVQSFYPDHYAVRFAAEQNYGEFYQKEIRFRRMMHYPPITALANVIAQDVKLEKAATTAKLLGDFLAEAEARANDLKVLGPGPAPLARLEGRFRIQFLLKCQSRASLNSLLQRLAAHAEEQGVPPRAYVIDMDPVNIM